MKDIVIRGAREHNLKNVSLTLPRNKMIVFTGLSGSGKSSLAFDTIYAEGQRRYVESLSSSARQFLGQLNKPEVDSIEGLSPAISIDQKSTGRNPRSTVGTVTEIHDYLRLLYARCGTPHCPKCGRVIEKQTVDMVADKVMALPAGTRIQINAPCIRGQKGQHIKLLESLKKEGFVRARIDGEVYDLEEAPALDKNVKHTIEAVVDRLVVKEGMESRLSDSLETAFRLGKNLCTVSVVGGEDTLYSQNYACPDCGISLEEMEPRSFSFNNPYGACPECMGLGELMKIDKDLVVPDPAKSLRQGAINVPGWNSATGKSMAHMYLSALCRYFTEKKGQPADMDMPFEKLPRAMQEAILYGLKEKMEVVYEREYGGGKFLTDFEGIIPNLERRYQESTSEYSRTEIEEYMAHVPCPLCKGKRLKKESLAVTVCGKNIAELSDMPVYKAKEFIDSMELTSSQAMIAQQITRELDARLGFLNSVGLGYLTLSRSAVTLSGGESQRIRLATQIGSGLVGVMYILDEPSIGLHQRDNGKLLATLKALRDMGNTLIVVEHDEETMLAADYIVDMGPAAGIHGGEIVAQGTPREVMENPASLTGEYLSGRLTIPVPGERRPGNGHRLIIRGARANNLKNITAEIPLGEFVCVTGVSGSGKSSLINEILKKSLLRQLNRAKTKPLAHDGIEGVEYLDKVVDIDQSPIGRTPRSNPATYTGLFDLIRELYASTPDAKMRGYGNGRFSFNTKGGRCEACKGDGILKIEMNFLSDVYVPCEVCGGRRYNRETLEVKYKGKNIYDVLEMSVEEALSFFSAHPKIKRKLQILKEVGLGYMKLGQPATTLSGGEAQRVKLATELSRRDTGRTLYILDEPTTGLHTQDVKLLLEILQRLVEGGSSVVVIEHNLHVIKTADYILDMGPEGGDKGGTLVASGTPEQVAACPESYTGQYLRPLLGME